MVEIKDKLVTLESLKYVYDSLTYKALSITSFTNNVGTAEKGSTVNSVKLSWSFNKIPSQVTLNGVTRPTDQTRSETYQGVALTSNATWTLKAKDSKGSEVTKTTSVTFANGVYYGSKEVPEVINSDFILSLSKRLSSTKLSSFSADAQSGQHIYYCLPMSMGACSFTVNGFTGGFSLVKTLSFTNQFGYTETYNVYQSDYAGLGDTTVYVS